jgi:DNA-binding transcriptional LysR family regulator
MTDTALYYFFEAASLGSMRLASDKIGVAVSSISRQIALLEQRLGVQLLERGRRSIKLTEAGRLAYDFYKSQKADREALLNQIQELRQMKAGRVDLAVGEGFLGPSFTGLIEAFQRKYPGITVSLTTGTTAEIENAVVEDEAHLGLIFNTSAEPKIRTRASVAQPLMVVCTPDHPLAKLERLTLEDLARVDICLPPKGFRIRQILSRAEHERQTWLAPKLTSNSLQVLREMARSGAMVTLLPRVSVISDLQEGALVALHLLDTELEDTAISLVHRIGRQLDGPPAELLSVIESKLKSWSETDAATRKAA